MLQIEQTESETNKLMNGSRKLTISSHIVPGVIAAVDSVLIICAGWFSHSLILSETLSGSEPHIFAVSFVWLVAVLLLHFAAQYEFDAIMRPLAGLDRLIVAFLTTFLFLLALAFSLKISALFSRIWIFAFGFAACATVISGRMLASLLIGYLVDQRAFTRNLVIVGDGQQAASFIDHIERRARRFVSIRGIYIVGRTSREASLGDIRVLGSTADLGTYIRRHPVDDVVIALPWSNDAQICEVTEQLRALPVNVYLAPDLIGLRLPFRPPPAHFKDLRVVELVDRPLSGWNSVLKAAMDYGLGLVLTILALPLMGLVALAIKLESRGPVFYRQERYGYSNKVFLIWKFRSMTHETIAPISTAQATRNDPRVTRVGRFLRRSSLDELPQLFNVLCGSMSLIGPRPHAVDHNEAFAKVVSGYFARHRVKPGITGWAQVNGLRGETRTLEQMARRVEYDVHYAENWSLWLDLKILLMTIFVCVTGKNAY